MIETVFYDGGIKLIKSNKYIVPSFSKISNLVMAPLYGSVYNVFYGNPIDGAQDYFQCFKHFN